uniref:ADAMTS-like 2 n=1 Tax=Xiphophorus couchianus TaxID=32473 RepID=A0A3B5L691_9TELE
WLQRRILCQKHIPRAVLLWTITPVLKEIPSAQYHLHRWETGQWSSCSTTCGVGLMTRTVTCTHRPSPNSNYSAVLKDEMCQKPKPSPFQACNRFDCPPTWDTRDWGQVKDIMLCAFHKTCLILTMFLVLCTITSFSLLNFKFSAKVYNTESVQHKYHKAPQVKLFQTHILRSRANHIQSSSVKIIIQ